MKKAFTLVELLVVVGILGILMAVLLGTFSGAGESARAAKCQANLRNLGMAVQACAMDSDLKSQKASTWISTTSGDRDDDFISPYGGTVEEREFALTNGYLWAAVNGSRECYMCPTHQVYAREHNLGQSPLWSYAMKSGTSASLGGADRSDSILLFAELPFADVKNGEFVQSGQISGDALDPILDPKSEKGDGGNEVIGFNHKNGKSLFAHVCYADGHVAKLVAPKTGDAQDLTMWLCKPTNDQDGDFDISFDGTKYKKVNATK